jgi:hypothetical protein
MKPRVEIELIVPDDVKEPLYTCSNVAPIGSSTESPRHPSPFFSAGALAVA